jgi:hypothetical protein
MRKALFFAVVAVAFGMLGVPANAEPITYTEIGVASGVFDGSSFTNSQFVLRGSSDTSNVFNNGEVLLNTLDNATVSIENVTDHFTVTVWAFSNNHGFFGPAVGFGATTGDIADDSAAAYLDYDLSSSISAFSGIPIFNHGPTATDGGFLQFSSISSVEFSADTGVAAPLPSTACGAMALMGALGLIKLRRHMIDLKKGAI